MEAIKLRLRCPECRSTLDNSSTALVCTVCGKEYTAPGGIPVLFSSSLSDFEKDELHYWDRRAELEWKAQDVARFYREDSLCKNDWNLYSYAEIFKTLPKDCYILEVGAGAVTKGLYLLLFQGFTNVVMTDISSGLLHVNRAFAEKTGINPQGRYYATDMADLPFHDNTFDVVMIHAALHHAPDPTLAIREMARCLKPGGYLIIGHEPNSVMLKPIRAVTRFLGLTEKQKASEFSVADEEDRGFTRGQLSGELQSIYMQIEKVTPVWYLSGFLFSLPVLIEKVFRKRIRISPGIHKLSTRLDHLIAYVPLVNRLCFHWTIIARKPEQMSKV